MVLQGGEKHCNSCGATTTNKIVGSCFVASPGKTNERLKTNVMPGLSHLILYLLQPFCTIFSGALLKKKRLSLSVFEVCFLSVRLQSSHMGGDVFVIYTLKSKAVVSYFFSSVTQTRIITVQLLVCVAAAGRMASVFCRPGECTFNCGARMLFSVRCKTLKVRLHNVLLPFYSNFLCCVTNNIEHFCICILLYFFDIFFIFLLDSCEMFFFFCSV